MSSYIHHEMLLFLQAVVTGAVLLLCYDLLRAFRRAFSHSAFWVAAEDLIFWAAGGLAVFSSVYRSNQGSLRFFLFLGIFLGALLCAQTISAFFVKVCTRILEIPAVLLKKLIKWLLFPIRRCKIFVYKCVKKERQANWVKQRKKAEKRI